MKKSKLLFAMSIMTSIFSSAQEGGVPIYQNPVGASNAEYASLTGSINDISKIQSFASVTDFDTVLFANIGTEGSNYLFDNFENHALIVAGEKKYTINNINYNVRLQRFESQLEEKNGLFVYDLPSISSLVVNGRQFMSVFNYSANTNDIYEVIHQDDNLSLLKSYVIRVIQGSPNPMVNRKKNKIKKEVTYFIKQAENLYKVKLSKKSIHKALNLSSDDSDDLDSWVKTHKLSYKKEADLKKIFGQATAL